MVHITTTSAFCSPEQDPFLLLESSLRCIEGILRCHVNQPLRRSWIEHPYGEEEIALLEEEMLPVLQRCLQRIDEIDAELEEELEAQIAIEQLRSQLAAEGEGREALEALLPL
ncbi:MAG: hypothetical protein NTV57_08580 [Cyanobacteria bacterium]|nr:hypothetical protein [Cyanobacteriota bacterium]